MIIDKNFRFSVTVSKEGYECKQDAIACLSTPGSKAINRDRMAWHICELSVDDFLKLATSGYCFCNLFTKFNPNKKYKFDGKDGRKMLQYPIYKRGPNKGYMKTQFKSDRFFKGAQTVFVDVDYTKYENVEEYLGTLTIPPTCVYMSFSDSKEKGKDNIISRRFRMVYIFDSILDDKAFTKISRIITRFIEADTCERMEDDCGTRKCQYMNGVFGNDETYRSDIIYSQLDFKEGGAYSKIPEVDDAKVVDSKLTLFDPQVIWDMENEDYKTFMHYYSKRFQYVYRTEKDEWIGDKDNYQYQMVDENYLQIYYYREKVQDGEHRRKKLFYAACLRRLIKPEIKANELLFNLYVDRERFYDNSDGVISIEHLKNKVSKVMKMSVDELIYNCSFTISYWREHRPKRIFKHDSHYNWGMIQEIEKNIRYGEIDELYDPTLSLRENIEAGLDVPPSTLYRYAKERGYETDPNRPKSIRKQRKEKQEEKEKDIEIFRSLYNDQLSSQDNMRILAEHGLFLPYRTFMNWRDKYFPKRTRQMANPYLDVNLSNPDNYIGMDDKSVEKESNNDSIDSFQRSWWRNNNPFFWQ